MKKQVKPERLSSGQRLQIFKRDSGVCQICGVQTRFFRSEFDTRFDREPRAGSVDHILPISHGGDNSESNLR